MEKNCKNCIWAEDCGVDDPCDDYSPIDESAMSEASYIEDLKMRAEAYHEVVVDYR